MKLQKWALIAEVVGSIAILATLIVLVIETRGNTAELRRQSALDRARFVSTDMLNSPDLAGLLARIKEQDGYEPVTKAFMDEYGFTAEEAIRFGRHLEGIWFTIQADFFAGVDLEEEVEWSCTFPDTRLFLLNAQDQFDQEFVDFYERVCAE